MKIAIIGHGKMGKQVEELALEKDIQITAIVDNDVDWRSCMDKITNADVAIEFSTPETAVKNIYKCFDIKLPVVSGTTGWHKDFEEVYRKCNNTGNSLFYASNFNIGMNIFFAINRFVAAKSDLLTDYSISIEETHHTQKLDSPSGTAITLANDLIENISWINKWINTGSDEKSELGIISHRKGDITGIHDVVLDSDYDTIKLSHSAKNRKGFASGALKAAEWLIGKKGVYTMSDLLKL